MNPYSHKVGAAALAAVMLSALAGCGGGGGGSGGSNPQSPPPSSGGTNQPPTISGTPTTSAYSGQSYSFQPSASDPEGQALTFSIAGKPAWATFTASTGRLSGTPTASNVGSTSSGIVISVSDGTSTTSLPSFSITVPNRSPTISGNPSTSVVAGQAYSFTPTASDPDGQTLAFGIANKPAWATFSTTTGRLSGTPTASDVKTFSNVVISVSDGTASATLSAFAVTVQAAAAGSVTLRWVAPTTNVDGSPLTNLAGYRVRYGKSVGALDQVVDISNPGTTTVTIGGLSTGTWYFTLSDYTNVGVESVQTAPVSTTIS